MSSILIPIAAAAVCLAIFIADWTGGFGGLKRTVILIGSVIAAAVLLTVVRGFGP